jgi:hypothetical protein
MTSDFEPWSVAAGLQMHEFSHLSPSERKKLVRLMARGLEQSFRRGLQHGVVNKDTLCVDPAKLRFDVSLDISPFTDSPSGGFTSIERLFMECGVLNDLGFEEPRPPKRFIRVPAKALTTHGTKQRRQAKRAARAKASKS